MLLAPFLNDGWSLADAESLRRGNSHLAALVQGQADRLFGMVVVIPCTPPHLPTCGGPWTRVCTV